MRGLARGLGVCAAVVGAAIGWQGADGASLLDGKAPTRWKHVATPGSPPARATHVMMYDPMSAKVVMFGGYGRSGHFADTWTFDGTRWTHVATPVSPPARAAAMMAYDEITHQLVLFGGYDGANYLQDTWLWDGTKGTWTEATPATVPPAATGPIGFTDPRTGHAMMFGGYNGHTYHHATWQWTGSDWVELVLDTNPVGRGAGTATYDAIRRSVIMFGGIGARSTSGTWLWNGFEWRQISGEMEPRVRMFPASAFEPLLGSVILFGGSAGRQLFSDTWAWNGRSWRQLFPRRRPIARDAAAMAYNPVRSEIVMFGGLANRRPLADTWVFVQR